MRVAIVGCGLIGNKRAKALGPAHALTVAADSQLSRAQQLAAQYKGCVALSDWRQIDPKSIDLVVVATTNDMLAPVTQWAVEQGKHVLVEKPAARNAEELKPVLAAAKRAFEESGVVAKVGFNHRFHPGLQKAHELFESGVMGPMMFIRARYGHGGRRGMEKEWRGNPAIAGGGEMLDQGVHLIDLSRWFLGEFDRVSGQVGTFFWEWPVEDNGFALLQTPAGQVAFLHASCTEWKNLFSFEIYGRDAKLHIEGLGGSYGVERLHYYKMLPQMGPPETTIWEYPGEDKSWQAEWLHFMECIEQRRQPSGNLEDAYAAMDVVGRLYKASPLEPAPRSNQ